MKTKSWTSDQLRNAASESRSVRQVLKRLGLKEAGGNYAQIKKYIAYYSIDVQHFSGRGWSRGLRGIGKPVLTLDEILVENSYFQSYKLKKRLFLAGLKKPLCEECGWSKQAIDGRIPVELDHINGNSRDNRIENLRILCPNCHSLKETHRGKNKKLTVRWRNRYTRST